MTRTTAATSSSWKSMYGYWSGELRSSSRFLHWLGTAEPPRQADWDRP